MSSFFAAFVAAVLSLAGAAPVDDLQPAERGGQHQVIDRAPTGLHGMPFAPEHLTGCDEASWYRQQAGLPDHFDGVIFRESSCRNDVSSWCCHGWAQIHRIHLGSDWIMACDVHSIDDLLGVEPLDKQRNLCAAAGLFAIQGADAWDAW